MVWPEEFSHFMERPVPKFIHLAVSRKGKSPLSCRGYACLPEGDLIWVYILRSQWLRLMESLQDRGWLAALLTSGVDNESYQVKGSFLGCRSLENKDLVQLKRETEWTRKTFPDIAALVSVNPSDCVAVAVEMSALYIQTPGPLAGSLLTERRRS